MVTDLLSLQLAFRALSDAPDGDEEVDTGSTDADEELEDGDTAEEGEEDLAAAGFGVEEPGEEAAE
jgi:hypothetical protein